MSDFNLHLIALIKYIARYRNKYNDFNGCVLGQFVKDPYRNHNLFLCQHLGGPDHRLSIATFLDDLVQLLQDFSFNNNHVLPDDCDEIGRFVDEILAPNFSLNNGVTKPNANQIRRLQQLRSNWTSKFNSSSNMNSTASTTSQANSSQLISSTSTRINSNLNESGYITKIDLESVLSSFKQELLNSLNSNQVNKSQPKNTEPQSFAQIGVNDNVGSKLEWLFDKKIRYSNHINNFNTHLDRKTTPASMFFCRFPNPLLWNNPDFVKMHNERIKIVQEQFMKQDIDFLKNEISKIDKQIEDIKSMESNQFTNDSSEVCKAIESVVETSLHDFISKSHEKVLRIVAKEYAVKSNNNTNNLSNISDASSINSENNSTHQQQQQTKRGRYNNTIQYRNNNQNNRRNNQQKFNHSNTRRNRFHSTQNNNNFNTPRSNRVRFKTNNNSSTPFQTNDSSTSNQQSNILQ